ncbi:MAG: MFS transporter [Dehalococcoidia bacterium]|nr:MFS transporter [Dehalococcoidia bacterium]
MRGMAQTLEPDARRSFGLLWAGQAISQLGDAIFLTTLLLWVADLTDSPAAVGAVLAVEAIPILLVSPLAGVFVDRWRYKSTLIYSDLARAVLVALLIIVQSSDLLWLIFIDVFLISVVTRFFFPSLMAALPVVAGEGRLTRSISYVRATVNVAYIAGPLIAAPLFVYAGPEVALAVNALSFLASAVALAFCRLEQPRTQAARGLAHVRQELMSGVRLVRSSRLQSTALTVGFLVLLGAGTMNAVNIFFIEEALNEPRSYLGLVNGLGGLGFAIGALALIPLANRLTLWRLIGIGLLLMGAASLVYAQLSLIFPALVVYTMFGLGNGVADTANQSFILSRTPGLFRGRIISLHTMAANAAVVGGSAAAGFLAESIDTRWLISSTSVLFVLAGCFALWSFSRLPGSDADEEPDTTDEDGRLERIEA